MSITDITLRSAKLSEKPFKIYDERGLYVLVNGSGKYFRLDYRFKDKRKTLSIGVYPDISLAIARERRDDARTLLAQGVDPSELKKLTKQKNITRTENTFEYIALEWISKQAAGWTESHKIKVLSRLKNDVFPLVGESPIAEITAPVLLELLHAIESRGTIDTAHRVKQTCSQIFRYAMATGKAERDSAADLRGALGVIKKSHFPTITEPKKIGELLRAIHGLSGSYVVRYAVQFAPLVFVRPGELRRAEWNEFNFHLCEWRIPKEKMKMRVEHIVPLAKQVVKILQDLQKYTGHGKYLFPSVRTDSRPMSENTVNAALRRLGYTTDEFTGHGFRAMASTRLHEMGYKTEWIERQLSHGERNAVKAAYNHAEYLPERRKMMQEWADYLDDLRTGNSSCKIIPFKSAAK